MCPTTSQYFQESTLIQLKQLYKPGFREFIKYKGASHWGRLFSIAEKCSKLEQRTLRTLMHIFRYLPRSPPSLPTDSANSVSLNLSLLPLSHIAFLSDSPIFLTANPILPVNTFYRIYLYDVLYTHLSIPVSTP